jgi:hypothetical protein
MPSRQFSLAPLLAALAVAVLIAVAAPAGAADTYGKRVALAETTPIAAIVADPDAWLGKTVRVEGRVADVCPMKGCWMELAEEGGGHVVRIKVDDGVIVFPSAAAGRPAVAEGVVKAIEMTREAYLGWLAHLAEERGETFDAEAAEIGVGPFRIIQIQATGAEIEAAGDQADPAAPVGDAPAAGA